MMPQEGTVFTIFERVRWSDCDPAHIIYYGAYIRLFEVAETELYRSVGLPYSVAFHTLRCFPIRAEYNCRYLIPAVLDDLLEIGLWISHWGTTSFTLSFRFTRSGTGEILAEGYCRLVTVDIESKLKMPIPEMLRERLAGYTKE